MKYNLKIIILSILSIMSLESPEYLSGQTHFYKRIKIVDDNNTMNVNDDAHYMTFSPSVCYYSDSNGNGLTTASMKYLRTENNINVYYGDSYFGHDTYCYASLDKSRLNIKYNGKIYVYVRTSETNCNATKRIRRNTSSIGATTFESNNTEIINNRNRKSTKRVCPGCNGKGRLPDQITYTATYIVENTWCDKCKEWMKPHIHHQPLCKVCNGKKYIE